MISERAPQGSSALRIPIAATTDDAIQARVAEARARLEREAGIATTAPQHFKRPQETSFTRAQRDRTTLLFGGLTWKHERLIHGAWEGLGYKCETLPTPDVRAFQLGKEYGNNGQCNPTYFTVGNLVQFLQHKRDDEGMTAEQLHDQYVFLTAGACGPCRFGMYEAEYRLALRNSGFENFRVMLFQQSGGLSQSEAEQGLEMNLDFFLGMLNAMMMGDLVNELAYQIRPYEVNAGETDRVLEESMDYLHTAMKERRNHGVEGRLEAFLDKVGGAATADVLLKFVDQLRTTHYTDALVEVRRRFERIPVDYTRCKPLVKITGEFWAQTTEGDGNFNMFRFLQNEGGEVLVEPIATWINYMVHQARQKIRDRQGLEEGAAEPSAWRLDQRLRRQVDWRKRVARLNFVEVVFRREYDRMRAALGGTCHALADQPELTRAGHPFYNSRAGGGEGHLEVAKAIYYTHHELAHMVLSVKPFGCMPSTQSDGAQSAVVSQFKDLIYLPIETSGEGEINAHSRVQMALGEAKFKAKDEYARALEAAGVSLDEIRSWVEAHPELRNPLQHVPKYKGYVSKGANFVLHVASAIRRERGMAAPAAAIAAAH
jgi:predicted nucleotide-binding protein (sugar kinase/HSP70/actin superfamily)